MLFESASAGLVAAYVVGLTMMVFCGLIARIIAKGLRRIEANGL